MCAQMVYASIRFRIVPGCISAKSAVVAALAIILISERLTSWQCIGCRRSRIPRRWILARPDAAHITLAVNCPLTVPCAYTIAYSAVAADTTH